MMLDDTPSPEKVYLLCGELLRDEGIENPKREHVARMLGYALTFAHINFSEEEGGDATDRAAIMKMIVTAAAAAEEWHEEFSQVARQVFK
ncbi:hypothetical protein O2N63_08955 [Aliiroseovarius sp. KMU-50]|uniref:Uncharacterized protein n=1 Tax=Aliiroseovarius salicola TaxID=3009082 RepID=A0ABT4W127_9RHOB|nr:hypothetical protein [Aliiroseovarius sp. KMU-50]MDA5094216.1 hypothetical protein [Aliiroseovarius sp. KMU-50]